jgi:hypothetical protein
MTVSTNHFIIQCKKIKVLIEIIMSILSDKL